MRDFVTRHSSDAGLPEPDAQDLVLAANEIATNSVRHGGGGGILRMWQDDGSVVCEVDDRGKLKKELSTGRVNSDTAASRYRSGSDSRPA